MAKGASISVGSDVKEVESGLKRGVIEPLEDVAEILQDVAKDGDKAGAKLEDAMRDAQKDTARLSNEYAELNRKIREAGGSGRRFGGDVDAGAREASESLKEVKQEALQNVSETFSSFDGSAQSFADMIQGTFGGVISGLGPLGIAVGAAGAAGIGLLVKAFEDGQMAEEEFRQNVSELVTVLIDTGGEGADALAAVSDRLKDIATETDKGAMNFDKLRAMSKDMGVEFADLAKAYVDGGGNLQDYLGKLDGLIDKEEEAYAKQQKYSESAGLGTTLHGIELEKTRDKLAKVAETYEQAEKDAAAWAEAGGAAIAARAEQMETLQGELDEAIGSWSEYYDAETEATDPAGYIAAMQKRMDATANFNMNVQQLAANTGLSFEETQAILDQGVDFAPMLAAIMAGGPEMQAQYAGQIRAMLDGGQAILDGTETTATITTKTDAQDAERQLDATATKERTAQVDATADTKTASAQLDAAAGKKRVATITATADTSDLDAQLSRHLNQTRVLTITVEQRTREGKLLP